MMRILFFLIAISAVSLAGVWMLEHNGILTIDWLGYRIQASLFFVCVTVISVFVASVIVVLLLFWLRAAPHRMAKHYADTRYDKGMVALTQGFAAVAAGDAVLAKKLTKQATHKLGKTPLTLLLQTQTAQLDGDDADMKRHLNYLLENKETEMIALKGLLLQAQKQGDIQEATKLAERAYEINPNAPWIVPVLADVYRHGKAWGKARKMLEESLKRKTALSKEQNRMLGILLLSEAEERLRMGDADTALNLSYRANKLVPGFAPAAVLLAAILLKLGKKRKAAHMLEQHWETMPHPDLAKAYIALYADESVEKQLKHAEKLASAYPDHSESHRIIAKYALMADDYTNARTHLKALLQIHPTVSAYKMMYELEKRENRPSAEVLQSWVEKAAHADQDAAWVCRECGYSTKAGWSQHCNNCDAFDSYQWKEASSVHLLKTPVVTALQN